MSLVTVRLPEILLHEVDKIAHILHLRRAEYIRKALELMNREFARQESSQRLKKVSQKVRKESMHINKEFSEIERDPDA